MTKSYARARFHLTFGELDTRLIELCLAPKWCCCLRERVRVDSHELTLHPVIGLSRHAWVIFSSLCFGIVADCTARLSNDVAMPEGGFPRLK